MKDFIIELMHDTSFGQSLNMREKFELLMHSGSRKRTINRTKVAAAGMGNIYTRVKELHKRKIESMLD